MTEEEILDILLDIWCDDIIHSRINKGDVDYINFDKKLTLNKLKKREIL